jgi:hypothetical protein
MAENDETIEVPVEAQTALYKDILASAFKGSRELPKLFTFLFDNRKDLLDAEDIEAKHYKREKYSEKFNPSHSREECLKLRLRLAKYRKDHPQEPVRCELPKATDIGGFQLQFHAVTNQATAVQRFWAAHFESGKKISIACDPLLFFYEHKDGMLFRYVDTNIEGTSRAAALAELKKNHVDAFTETLIAGHLYVDVGAILGAELIRTALRDDAGIEVPLILDKQGPDRQWLRASPILLGTGRTNAAIRGILDSEAGKSIAYRLDDQKFYWACFRDLNDKGIACLEGAGFSVDKDGNFTPPSPDLTIGTVTRIPNPSGSGVITFIASDSTFNTKQVAFALTNETQLRAILQKTGWSPDEPLPDVFEMMFLVRLWPGGFDDEGSDAELVAWRPRSS